MNTYLPVLISIICLLLIGRIIFIFKDRIKFYSMGLDSGFKIFEINLLWKLAKVSELKDPTVLYWSVPALDKSISSIISSARESGIEQTKKIQDFLQRLYNYRTKIELNPKNKSGLSSTKYIDVGQKLRIIIKGKNSGVFSSQVVKVGRDLIISLPLKDNQIVLSGVDWVGNLISVYFWRKDDAAYVFDAYVRDGTLYNGKSVLCIPHTEELVRAQKRKSVRCNCHILAQMYIIKDDFADLKALETEPGLKCLLEDISEDGALIRVGGKGVANIKIKIQFTIGDNFIVMAGLIKGVQYDEQKKQSKLHFECTCIDTAMKNAILSYVYNVLPQEEKEIIEAINLAEKDDREEKNDTAVDENPSPVSEGDSVSELSPEESDSEELIGSNEDFVPELAEEFDSNLLAEANKKNSLEKRS